MGNKLVFAFYGEKYLLGEDFLEFHFSFENEDVTLGDSGNFGYLEFYLQLSNDKVIFKEFKNGNGQYFIKPKCKDECQMFIGKKSYMWRCFKMSGFSFIFLYKIS